MWAALNFTPGVWKDDSPLKAAGGWTDADKIRFVNGLPETIYGWERASMDVLLGITRGLMTWTDNARNPYAAFGTNLRLYTMDINGLTTDITPIVAGPTNSVLTFQATLGSPVVNVTNYTHGLVVDQKFSLSTTTIGTIGGIQLSGQFVASNIVGPTAFDFNGATSATSNAGPTGSTSQISTYLAPGQVDGLGGLGYGTGGYGSGGYGGGSSSYDLFPRTWSLAQYGADLLASPRGGGIYQWTPGDAMATIVPNAPTQVGSMFVTSERILVACGSNLGIDGYRALGIDWSDNEDITDWVPVDANLAGGFDLSSGSRIVRGLPGPRENVIWTTTDLWAMRFVQVPGEVYQFIPMGPGGLIGPNAAANVGGIWYWMTPAGAFYYYDGTVPRMVPCTLSRDLQDNLAWVQQDKIYATPLVGKNYAEVWWFYPDIRDGNECSRYVILDTVTGAWSCGRFNRTSFTDASVFQFPLATDTQGQIWFHEKGFTQDGGARSWSVTGAYNTNVKGEIVINGIRPDSDDLQGGYTITPFSRTRSVKGIRNRTYPALSITAATGEKSCRVKGEQVGVTIAGTSAPAFWRLGMMEVDGINTGAKR